MYLGTAALYLHCKTRQVCLAPDRRCDLMRRSLRIVEKKTKYKNFLKRLNSDTVSIMPTKERDIIKDNRYPCKRPSP
jgi:hypothetical protein